MNQRLTRKDMKRDEFTAVVGRGVEYAETHVRTLVYAVGGVLLLIALAVGFYYYRNGQKDKANQALADAMKAYHAPVTATGAKPTDPDEPSFPTDAARRARAKELLTKVHRDYGSTDAGDVAGLYPGQIAADEGHLAEARKLWSDYADDHKGSMLGAMARLNLLNLDRKQGKSEAVVKELRSMLEKGDSLLPQDLILRELGASLEDLHRPQEAIQSYQRIIDEFPQSTFRAEAQQKITALDPTRAAVGGGMPGLPPGFPG